MRYLPAALITLLLLANAAYGAPLHALRGPILMDYGASPRFAVTFNHSSHKKVKCRTCHHIQDAEGKRFVACTIEPCHSQAGARLRNPESMFMAYHAPRTDRSCYGCHRMNRDKHPEFRGCRPCHMSPMARQAMETAKTSAQ